jgi:hypothetical protein
VADEEAPPLAARRGQQAQRLVAIAQRLLSAAELTERERPSLQRSQDLPEFGLLPQQRQRLAVDRHQLLRVIRPSPQQSRLVGEAIRQFIFQFRGPFGVRARRDQLGEERASE